MEFKKIFSEKIYLLLGLLFLVIIAGSFFLLMNKSNREYVAKGKMGRADVWQMKLVEARREKRSLIITFDVLNLGSNSKRLNSYVMFALKSKSREGISYIYDVENKGFDKGVADKSVPLNVWSKASVAFQIDEDVDLKDLYIEFKPIINKSEVYKFDVI
jgi:hypothetical protein